MKKFKQFLEEKIILSAAMCVLLVVVLVTATYGWYSLSNTPKAYGLELSTGGSGGLMVSTESKGKDIMVEPPLGWIEGNDGQMIAKIPINLRDFENIESEEIAPGAFSCLPFYITSLSPNIRSYEIKIQFEYKPSENAADNMTAEERAEQKERVESMIMDHFSIYQSSIYQEEYTDSRDISKSSEPLPFYLDEEDQEDQEDQVISAQGNLELNVEVPVELYWVWNYELTDIDEYWELERFNLTSDSDDATVRKAVRQYDEEDTELGNYLDDIWFNIYIEGRPDRVN